MGEDFTCELAILGGGLAGGLIALALAERRPEARVLLVEQGDVLGGNHIWSFFDGDIAENDRWLVDPLVTHRWEGGHDVRFPSYARTLETPYNSIASEGFDAHLRAELGDRILLGAQVTLAAPDRVVLADGRSIAAQTVIDARGGGDLSDLACGWQKFVGQTLELAEPHRLARPTIMDATVAQRDGFRFVYILPTGPNTVFVEDTYYSETPDLDVPVIQGRIADYARKRGWRVESVVREETGVLPVVMSGDFARFWPAEDSVARAGVRAGLFHPTTGYSLPDAVTFALWLADVWPVDSLTLAPLTRAWARARWRQGGYYRMLDRMLFRAATTNTRRRIFEHFYRLPADLVGRFYSGRSTWSDKRRILCGRPPVPIRAAMRAIFDTHHP